jgi:ubiquinone/menaquinone biosynthesis C-methylase UbiE
VEIGKHITMSRTVKLWGEIMENVFRELYRITKPGGWVAFAVSEIRNGSIRLDEVIVPLGFNAEFSGVGILINNQKFSKTSNIWGIHDNVRGTNSNRVVMFSKTTER